jgi:predicted Zn-dependent protease
MNKVIIQGLFIVASFFLTWFALQQVDWVEVLNVKQATQKTEEKLGEIFWETVKKSEKIIKKQSVNNSVDSIVAKICTENSIDRDIIKVHIVDKDEVNAFALPGSHLVIFSGLILACDNQQELSGVICHEIAHIELNHVMKKLVKEIGLSVLISITTGNNNAETTKGVIKLLSSSAFDRSLEREADLKAVDFLVNAQINPEPFANFLYKLADNDPDQMKYLSWISTHPESKERAEEIIEYSKTKKIVTKPVLDSKTWDNLLFELRN